MWPSAKEQIQTSVHAGGMANVLMRFNTSGSESLGPLVRVYVNPLPVFFRRMPGRVSETYLRPADSAASFRSTIACALPDESTSIKALASAPKTNLSEPRGFHKQEKTGEPCQRLRLSRAPVVRLLFVVQMPHAPNKRGMAVLSGPVDRLPLCFKGREYMFRMIFHHIVIYRAPRRVDSGYPVGLVRGTNAQSSGEFR